MNDKRNQVEVPPAPQGAQEVPDWLNDTRTALVVPLFNECRSIVGTADWMQDDALRRALLRFAQAALSRVPAEQVKDAATVAGLEASIDRLSAIVDSQLILLKDVEAICGVDGHGGPLEDGESKIIDRVRSHLAGMAKPAAQESHGCHGGEGSTLPAEQAADLMESMGLHQVSFPSIRKDSK